MFGITFQDCELVHNAAQCIARGIVFNDHFHQLAVLDSSIDDKCKNILMKPFLTKYFVLP